MGRPEPLHRRRAGGGRHRGPSDAARHDHLPRQRFRGIHRPRRRRAALLRDREQRPRRGLRPDARQALPLGRQLLHPLELRGVAAGRALRRHAQQIEGQGPPLVRGDGDPLRGAQARLQRPARL